MCYAIKYMSEYNEYEKLFVRLRRLYGLPTEDLDLYNRIVMLYQEPNRIGGSFDGLCGHLEESAKLQAEISGKYERLEERPLCCERNRFPIVLLKS